MIHGANMKKPKRNYLSNANLMEQIKISKENNKMSNELTKMLMLLCDRYASSHNFVNYTFLEDMKMFALMNLCNSWHKFDETRFANPFAYYTQSIKNSYIQYLKNEKKHRNIRDALLVKHGANPSFNYVYEHTDEIHLMDPALAYNTFNSYESDPVNYSDLVEPAVTSQ